MKISEKFIKATDELCSFEKNVNAPLFRRKFNLDFIPENACITICGLGFYELYINGENITKGYLAPYISNTNELCYYDNYDISKYLNKGENVIGVILGNGFRNPFGGFVWGFDKSEQRGALCLALCLEAYCKGERFMLEADEEFKIHPSPVLFDDLRMGYCYDENIEIADWNKVDFDDSKWESATYTKTPSGVKRICNVEPIKEIRKIIPISAKHFDEMPFAYEDTSPDAKPCKNAVRRNVWIFDFGENISGVTRIKINSRKGQKITVRHGEWLQNGRFSINTTAFLQKDKLEKYIEYSQKDVFICKGGETVLEPKFKYDGFRYAYVEGLEEEQITDELITAIVINSDLEIRADFNCSSDVLNQLQACVRRSDLSNFFYFPTDCPHREKNGWTADASISAEHMILNLKAEKSLKEWLVCIRKSQKEDGSLPGMIPTMNWGYDYHAGPAWSNVCVILPYYIYRFSGDMSVISENADMIVKYLTNIFSKRNDDGLIEYGYGDWMDPIAKNYKHITSPVVFTDSACVYDMAKKARILFEIIGDYEKVEFAEKIEMSMRNSIRKNLINFADYTVCGNCQTSQAVALEFGLFNDNEVEFAQKRLVDIIHRDNDITKCGMIGLRHIFHALTKAGESDLAYKMIVSESRSCYGYFIKNGATTLWESFKSVTASDIDSRNHHFFGDISSWFIQEVVGIIPNPELNDINSFWISPHFLDELIFAEASYETPFGKLYSKWKKTTYGIDLYVNIPHGINAKLYVNNSWAKLKTGQNTFFFNYNIKS